MGEEDLDDVNWSCDEDMKPESWEEMLESRAGACWGSVELRYRWRGWWWWKRWCEEEEEEEEEGEWEWEPLDPLESLLLTLFRLLWKGKEWWLRGGPEEREVWQGQGGGIKRTQRHGLKKGGWIRKNKRNKKREGMKAGDWGETGWETINTAHQDAAGSDWGQCSQNNKPTWEAWNHNDHNYRQEIAGFLAFWE